MQYDYLIVGSGLFGASFAQIMREAGKSCLVLEKRKHTGGNVFTESVEGIEVHKYGPHIFHTNDESAWRYATRFADFNSFINSPIAIYRGKAYNLPFNMNTFNQMWGVTTPQQALAEIERQKLKCYANAPENFEQAALGLVGRDIYEKLICGYTEKQWGRACTELPPEILLRLPLRFMYDNNYYNARRQGIPRNGYTKWIGSMLNGIKVCTDTDYLEKRTEWERMAHKVLFTGPIDAYFDYRLGALEYRTIRFENEILDTANYQGNAVVNYTDKDIPYTRVIEHKHFAFGQQEKTVISREYSMEWHQGMEPYYPIGDKNNRALYEGYYALAQKQDKVIFGGRLAEYQYYDMDKIITCSLELCKRLLH